MKRYYINFLKVFIKYLDINSQIYKIIFYEFT